MNINSAYRDIRARAQEGIALIMVLWILTILTVVVLSFTSMTRTETLASVNFRKGVEKKFLAESGIERGIMEIVFRRTNKAQNVILDGMEVWNSDGTPHTLQIETGTATVRIFDESGKVDINRTPELILRNLLNNLEISPEDADIITDSIMDWRDADDLHRLHGAEDEYYASLATPYRPKNANFEAIEELLLVRGMTPGILYGSDQRKGIAGFLTVHGRNSRININAASREVIIAAGASEEAADAIIEARKTRYLTSPQEFGLPPQSLRYFTAGDGSTFTIESVGYGPAGTGGYVIRATVATDPNNIYRYLSYQSPAEPVHD